MTTELARWDEVALVVRAEIALPSGASASGLASASPDRPGAVELAETRALARALRFLGFGAGEPATASSAPARPAATPQPPRQEAESPTPAGEPATRQPERQPRTTEPSARAAEPPARPAEPPAARTRPATATPAASTSEAEPVMEDFSWTSFWNWARRLGYQNKGAVESAIGQSITSLSPAQVRNLLREKTGAE